MNDTRFFAGFIVVLFALFYGWWGITDIDPGETGILIKKLGTNRGMQKETLDTGTYWIEPLRFDVAVYDVKFRQYNVANLPAQSMDGQPIKVDSSFEIGLADAQVPNLHETVGRDWYERIVFPAIRSSVRNATAEHLSDTIYTGDGRKAIKQEVTDILQTKLAVYGILMREVNLRDLTFQNTDFVQVLEEKAKAAQRVTIEERNAEAAEQTAIKVANIAEGEKQKVIKQSEAEREKLRLEGEGERLKQEEIAKGILAIKTAQAEGARLHVNAYGDGQTYASVIWAENLGPNVKVLGYPLGAPGTTGIFLPDGILGDALQLKRGN